MSIETLQSGPETIESMRNAVPGISAIVLLTAAGVTIGKPILKTITQKLIDSKLHTRRVVPERDMDSFETEEHLIEFLNGS